MYFIFGIIAGIVGGIMRVLIRTELREMGPSIISENSYNVLITAHGLIIIFFFSHACFNGGVWKLTLAFISRLRGHGFPSIK